MYKIKISYLGIFILFALAHKAAAQQDTVNWKKLTTVPYKGKQDDIYFTDPANGWYVNGSGKIFRTRNGGREWQEIYSKPGTYFRCVGFIDSLRGFAGNLGTDYFPKVTDTVPIYQTKDGGLSWQPVSYKGPRVKGLCAIDILKIPFINAGILDYKVIIHAAGRVGGPTFMLTSTDGGENWSSMDMNPYCKFIVDIKFFNAREGVICAASDTALEASHALIITTSDGGKTWQKRYESRRPFEITWKESFPDRKTGYVTIQNYDPDTANRERYLAKTIDGGKTWKELKLVDDHSCTEFGAGFVNEKFGWIGGMTDSYQTADGGKSWKKVKMGHAVNKIRILKSPGKITAYAIGSQVYKYEAPVNP